MTSSSLLCFICISKGLMSSWLNLLCPFNCFSPLYMSHYALLREFQLFPFVVFYSCLCLFVCCIFFLLLPQENIFLCSLISLCFPLSLHVPSSLPHLPPAPQAAATCALQSAAPVLCCLPRPLHHPLPLCF